ncbi:Uncharacterised protein [Serratia liquefaciens]|nr:Uncharacterised protein [Serratia liquefaciens]
MSFNKTDYPVQHVMSPEENRPGVQSSLNNDCEYNYDRHDSFHIIHLL